MKSESTTWRIAIAVVLLGLCFVSANASPPAAPASGTPVPLQVGARQTGATYTIFLPLITRGFFARDFLELGAPDNLAVVNEPYTSTVGVVSYDPSIAAVTGFQLAELGTPGITAPHISSDGTLTWTPTLSDTGIHRLMVTAVVSDGSSLSKAITIEVAPRTMLIAAALGDEGGLLQTPNGDYAISLPPHAVADGAAAVNVELSVVKRTDGSVQLTHGFSGLKPGVTPTLATPLYAVSALSTTALSTTALSTTALSTTALSTTALSTAAQEPMPLVASGACQGLDFVTTFNPDPIKWKGGYVWNFDGKTEAGYRYFSHVHQNVSSVRQRNRVTIEYYLALPGKGMMELRGACRDQKDCLGKQPVLFVHGYNTFGALSGGVETWGCAFDYVKSLGGVPFEFSWRANTRFEDAAYYLSQAIAHVSQLTGRKPLIVAHSMGGLLSTTYLAGLAEMPDETGQSLKVVGYDSADARGGRRSAAVAGLVTVSSPLSGIASQAEGAAYGLPQGRDTHPTAWSILACNDFTCGESGLSSTQLTFPGSGTDEKTSQYYQQVLGIPLGAPGSLVNKLYTAWRTNRLADIHYDVLVSTWYVPGTPDWKDKDYGDGLIAVTGMQVLPTHLVGTDKDGKPYNYIRTYGRALTPDEKLRANIPANLDYTFMLTRSLTGGYFGYPHGGLFYNYADWWWWVNGSSNPNAPAAIFPSGGKLTYYGAFDHSLKPVLDRAYASAAAQTPVFQDLTPVSLTVTGTVRQVIQPGSVVLPLASAPVLVAFFNQGAYVGMVAGVTDATGAFSIDVGRVLDDYGLADLTGLSLQVRIGNDTTVHAVTKFVDIGQVSATTDLGTIDLNPR